MALYQTSRDLWLERHGDRVAASNVFSGRCALLTPSELGQLLQFCQPRRGDNGEESFQRLLQADLIHRVSEVLGPSPVLASMEEVMNRYLSRQGVARSTEGDLCAQMRTCRVQCAERLASKNWEVRRDLESIFRNAETFLKERNSSAVFAHDPTFLASIWSRPAVNFAHGQLPCMPETTARRVSLAWQDRHLEGSCLVLGDDDLMSLFWSCGTTTPCHVFEIDEALVSFLHHRNRPNLELFEHDLSLGLPLEHHNRYPVIFTDPMYEREGMDSFFACCAQALRYDSPAKLFLTTRLDLIEDGELLEERLAGFGLRIEQSHQSFSRYPLPAQTRRRAYRRLVSSGLDATLLKVLLQVPFYYADMLEVTRDC